MIDRMEAVLFLKKKKEKKKANPKPGGEPWDPHGSRPLKASRLEIRLKNDGALL